MSGARSSRDTQQSRVYKAEDMAMATTEWWRFHAFDTIEQVDAFLENVLADPWWEDKGYPRIRRLDCTRAKRSSMGSSDGRWIIIAWGHYNRWVVLHELAHAVTPHDVGHGPEFCLTFLRMVEHYIGSVEAQALSDQFINHRVTVGASLVVA